MASKDKVQLIMAMMRGENIPSARCPVYEFVNGVFECDDECGLHGELKQIGWMNFIHGLEVIMLPLKENDKREISLIERGESLYEYGR